MLPRLELDPIPTSPDTSHRRGSLWHPRNQRPAAFRGNSVGIPSPRGPEQHPGVVVVPPTHQGVTQKLWQSLGELQAWFGFFYFEMISDSSCGLKALEETGVKLGN